MSAETALRDNREARRASLLAERILDRWHGDPDDDLAILARAVVRLNERAALASPESRHLDFCSGGEFCTLDDCLCKCHAASPESRSLDVETLARALVFHRYGIRVEEANPADIADATAVAAEYARLRENPEGEPR